MVKKSGEKEGLKVIILDADGNVSESRIITSLDDMKNILISDSYIESSVSENNEITIIVKRK